MGRLIGAIVALFVAWSAMDFVIHGMLLTSLYEETKEFWRPQEEYKYGLMNIVTLVSVICFTLVYAWFFKEKNLMAGLKYGLLFGIGSAITMGYGTYTYMPIPYHLALYWFLGRLAESLVAGAILGAIVKDDSPPVAATES